MLTVARAASDAPLAQAQPASRCGPATSSPRPRGPRARPWPARPTSWRCCATPGVVDAGGRGLSVILDAAETALTGRRPMPVAGADRHPRSRSRPPSAHGRPDPRRPVLRGDVPPRRRGRPDPRPSGPALAPLGDSLVVVGGDGLWNVHVHVDDVGAAIEAGIAAGRPYRVRVTHFAEQIAGARQRAAGPRADAGRRGGRRSRSRRALRGGRCGRRRRAARAAARRPVSCSRRSPAAAPRRWSCCPTTPTRCGPPRSPPRTAETDPGLRWP